MATVMSEVRFFTSATILVSEREQHGYWSFLLVTCQDPYINPCNSDIFKWGLSELLAFWLAVSAHCGGDGSGGGERGSPRGRDPGQTVRGGEKEIRIGKYNSMNRIKIFTKKKENRRYWSFLLVTCQDPYINPCNSDIFKWGLSELLAFWLAVSAHCGGDGSGGGERGSPRGRDPGQTVRGGEKEIRIGKYNSMNRIKIFTKKKENRSETAR
ncbi:hypothetical protein F2Q69_00053799 [Brassica cretica]|uniref:Uncharacterized protein n=1 Tax=Brassica cretica TaxID=69181 RepID=A0A8S9MXR7_BRACR|nr:hypothetical protein F2Q69_00053799 [Brassica cretica]